MSRPSPVPPCLSRLLAGLDVDGTEAHYLELDGPQSWLLRVPRWLPITVDDFNEIWSTCPAEAPILNMAGGQRKAARRQRRFGADDVSWSGQTNPAPAQRFSDQPHMQRIADMAARLEWPTTDAAGARVRYGPVARSADGGASAPVGALLNFYDAAQNHHVGKHSDAHHSLVLKSPILSVSWGQTRRFKLTPSASAGTAAKTVELSLGHGDLVIMGGACQQTHKHELVTPNKCERAGGGVTFGTRRLNATFRFFVRDVRGGAGGSGGGSRQDQGGGASPHEPAAPRGPTAKRGLDHAQAAPPPATGQPAKRRAGVTGTLDGWFVSSKAIDLTKSPPIDLTKPPE